MNQEEIVTKALEELSNLPRRYGGLISSEAAALWGAPYSEVYRAFSYIADEGWAKGKELSAEEFYLSRLTSDGVKELRDRSKGFHVDILRWMEGHLRISRKYAIRLIFGLGAVIGSSVMYLIDLASRC